MDRLEREWDTKLKIDTIGRDDSMEDDIHHAYEPTPYSVLERIRDTGLITQENILVDYGCGKGRAALFLAQSAGCASVGIDFDKRMIDAAEENLQSFLVENNDHKVSFLCTDATEYDPGEADTFYFFNPFDEKILDKVIGRIIRRSRENDVQALLFFYYPSDEYVSSLMTMSGLSFYDEIDTGDLFEGEDEREKVLIFCTE